MANNGGTGGALFQRFRKIWSEWLETGQLPKIVQILVALFLFVAGIAFQLLLAGGFQQVFRGEQRYTLLIILLFTVSAIILTIVASVWIGSLNSILRRVTSEHQGTREEFEKSQDAMLDAVQTAREQVDRGQEAIMDAVKSLVGLAAEYIDDKDRAYQRTQELITNARERLIFVDWWVDIHQYDTGQPRKDYYQAITARIERHLEQSREGGGGHFFHERIVQMDVGTKLRDVPGILSRDSVYWEHIRTCVELQEEGPRVTSVYIGEPYTRTHFAIIDNVFVQPILTTGDEGLQRYGAILYTDRHGELIRRYEQLLRDLQKRKLTKKHIITNEQTK